jgi:uncharacterized protein YqhQ
MSDTSTDAVPPGPTSSAAAPKRPYIGGQAVLEGVMMRAPNSFAIVVRRRDGSLHVRERRMPKEDSGVRKIPFVRGVMSLVDSLKLGSEALRFSADQLEKDMEAEELEQARASSKAKKADKKAGLGASTLSMFGSLASFASRALTALGLSLFVLTTSDDPPAAPEKKKGGAGMVVPLVLMIVVMWALPQGSAALLNHGLGLKLEVQSPGFQAITGAFKLLIVVGYMSLLRRMRDTRRVFQYHGAEHKTISTYEAGEELTVQNARAKTTLHPRCGTTFLVMVVLISILTFTALGGALPRIHTGRESLDNVLFFLVKLPFIPVIAGFTFEMQRIFARFCTTGPLRALLWPGFLVQKITTIEPDDRQLEVALASLKATLFREEGKPGDSTDDVRFANYDAMLKASALRSAKRAAAAG